MNSTVSVICLATALMVSAQTSSAQAVSQDTLPDNHLLFTLHRVNSGFRGGNQFLTGYTLSLDFDHGAPASPLTPQSLRDAIRRGDVTGLLTNPTGITSPIVYEIVRYRGPEDIYMKSVLGFFLWEAADVRDDQVSFVIDWWYTPPASGKDVAAVAMAASLLADSAEWHKRDDRECEDDLAEDRWSLFCALKHASVETMGEYNHHNAAMNTVRFVIDEMVPDHGFAHTLMDFNNADSTTHSHILGVLARARRRLEQEIAASEPLRLSAPVEHLARVAVREPMLAEHPDGTLFVAGFTQAIEETGKSPKLFSSRDRGVTWEAVDVGTPAQGAVGNSDVDLAVGPDGTLYFLTMGFDRTRGEGTHVAVGVSRDVGATWVWTYLSQDRFDDRPWIAVAPDGVVHVIWNDGQGVCHAVSSDAGHTWTEQPRIHPHGGSSHLAVGLAGEVAVRIIPRSASGRRYDEGVDLLAVSLDEGTTWKKHPPPGSRAWVPTQADPDVLPRWVEPLAWDAEGALYYLWSEGSVLWLGRSRDRGETWESWAIVRGDEPLYFPYLTARGRGKLAATWFSGLGDNLRAHVALIDASAAPRPSLRSADPFQLDSWRGRGDTPSREPGGEYLPVLFLSNGEVGLAAPIQNPRENRLGFAWYRISY